MITSTFIFQNYELTLFYLLYILSILKFVLNDFGLLVVIILNVIPPQPSSPVDAETQWSD